MHALHSIKSIIKRLAILLVSLVVFLSVAQTAVLAASSNLETKTIGAPGVTEPLPDEDIGEMREERREWQSKASASQSDKADKSSSLGEAVKDKLNINELVEGKDSDNKSENIYERTH